MRLNPLVAYTHVHDARQLVDATEEKLQQVSSENRAAYEKFYNNLAVFSGGTVALSITYLGYLKSTGEQVLHQNLLIASWAAFLVCLLPALFSGYFYACYMHYAGTRNLALNRKKQCEVELEALPQLNMPELTSPVDRQGYADKLRVAIQEYGKSEKWAQRRESLYYILWKGGGTVARLSFWVGFLLLYFFAVKNM